MRTPVAAIGCPNEMPEPFTLSLSGSFQPQPLSTARACAAKASFNSNARSVYGLEHNHFRLRQAYRIYKWDDKAGQIVVVKDDIVFDIN